VKDRTPLDDGTLVQSTQERAESQERSTQAAVRNVPGYRIQHLLGRGAYGEVWLAHHVNTGRDVAIKFFSSFEGLDWPLLKREVGKLAQASSERRIVHLLEVGWDADPPYYVMEYLQGGSLAARVANGPLPIEQATALVTDIGTALLHLHSKAILHCDLKPSNVLLDDSGQIRLADFGQARLLGEEGSAAGTLFYMAPELCEPNARPDVRSDIYSLGALLFTLLAGRPPYAEEATARGLQRRTGARERLEHYRQVIASSPAPNAHRRVKGVDTELAEVVDRCLARDPALRYDNVQQMLDALAERGRRRARRPLLLFGLVGPMLILGAMSAMALWTWRATESQASAALAKQAVEGLAGTANAIAAGVDQKFSIATRRLEREAEKDDLREMMARATEAADPEDRPGLRTKLQKRIEDLYRDPPAFYSWTIADGNGVAWARAPFDANVVHNKYAYREWFSGRAQTRPGEPTSARRATGHTRAFISTARERPLVMSIATPIWAPGKVGEGDPAGVIAATFEVASFHEWLHGAEGKPLDDGCPERIALLFNRGQLVRHPCPTPGSAALPLEPDAFFGPAGIERLLAAGGSDAYFDPLHDGRRYVAAAVTLPTQAGWVVVVQQDHERALAPVATLSARFRALASAATVVGGAVTVGLLVLLLRLNRSGAHAA
jgi:hypothetical protein